MRFVTMILPLLLSGVMAADTKPEVRELVRKSLAGINKEDKRMDEYGFVRRWRRTEFNSDGSVRTKQEGAWRRVLQDGVWVGLTFERNGKPLTAEETAKQEEAARKYIAERKAMGEAEWKRRQAANRKKGSSDEDEWLQEFPEALDYQVLGEELIDGRAAVILQAEPRAGYSPKNMRAKVFEKMRGKLWIDKAEGELVRGDAETFDTVNIGFGILGKIEKGTHFHIERRKVGGSFWTQTEQSMKFDARVMLVKTFKQEIWSARSEFRHKSELLAVAGAGGGHAAQAGREARQAQ